MKTTKLDLSKLPLRYQKFGKNWKDTKTGAFIPAHKITEYLPKQPVNHETITAKRYDLKY